MSKIVKSTKVEGEKEAENVTGITFLVYAS